MVNKAVGNQHLQFTVETWTNNKILPSYEKMNMAQISTADEFPFLYMNIIWSPTGYTGFRIFGGKGQKFKCVGNVSTHTPITLRAIPLGVLN